MRNIEKTVSRGMFVRFVDELAEHLNLLGHYRTAETYHSAMKSFLEFNSGNDILISDITQETMQMYEAYLLNIRHVTRNSSSFYMRIIRSIYNKAVKRGIVEDCNPFALVYTGVDRTSKRALSLYDMKRIKDVDLSFSRKLDKARDIFLFSFYTRGMSFVDIAFLKKSDIRNGELVYCRRKTGQRLCIRWERCMQEIVDKHGTGAGEYLMPIIMKHGTDERRQYINSMSNINDGLRRISRILNLNKPLTMYVARHSWASIARSKNVPISVISEGMGHESELTTRIYLASIEASVIDEANNVIIKSLLE